MLGFGRVRNLQGTENAREDKLESARIGNCKVMVFGGNEICVGMELARN